MDRQDESYTTGQFAKLCGVKKQTLFHYDDIGLLKPVLVEENGYRRYSHEQYGDFLLISCLKETGMSLAEIRGYLQEEDEARRGRILTSAMRALDARIAHLEQARQILSRAFPQSETASGPVPDLPATRLELLDRAETPVLVSPDLSALDDRELVETVAGIVKVAEPFAACLRSSDVLRGTCGDPVCLLVEDEGDLGDAELAACGLRRSTVPAGRYARYSSTAEREPQEFYRAFVDELAAADLVPGTFFVEEYGAGDDGDGAAAMSAYVSVE